MQDFEDAERTAEGHFIGVSHERAVGTGLTFDGAGANVDTNRADAHRPPRPRNCPAARGGWLFDQAISDLAAIDGGGENSTDLLHSCAAETTEAGRKIRHGNIERGIELDHAGTAYRVFFGFKADLCDEVPVDRAAWCDDHSLKRGNRGITRQHSHRSAVFVRNFAPPDFAPLW